MDTTAAVGTTSISMDTTTMAKRRDQPPLNVYLRIRPFIGDEIERGENQKLLDILDDRHIAVKLCPTTYNAIRTVQASYNEYEVTRIFDQQCTQQELFDQILAQPTNEIFTGSNWLLCTLGLTNSGKTHTMFGTPQEPGLIPKCLHRIFLNVGQNIDDKVLFKPDGLENLMPTDDTNLEMEIAARNYIFKDDKDNTRRARLPNIVQQEESFQDLSVEDEHYSVWISFFELYNETIFDLLIKPKDMKTRKGLRLMQNDESTMIKNLVQIPVFDLKEAEDTIRFGFANRATSKTNLNEASSRSHAVLCITLITIDEFDEEPVMSHMYICDLAGNEPSTGTGKHLTETCNINTSLMTFKDCVRVLNENQTAKKQRLLPYRNSVLTSIFRPFFVGRGRTIICCNVNPCAAFISQTNDLLKFSALAQKTIIVPIEPLSKIGGGGLIRQQRKSKNKGPKRLGRDAVPVRVKNKQIEGGDASTEDLTEDLDIISIDASSVAIPTNVKSITYWKYCTKKAMDLLQKQAASRRAFLIERHQERVKTVQYLLHQRQQLDTMSSEKQSMSQKLDSMTADLCKERHNHIQTQQLYDNLLLSEKQQRSKLLKLERELQERDAASRREADLLRLQLKTLQDKFDLLTNEHLNTIEQTDQHNREHREREQLLTDEVQRLKRDLGLELYRKQDAEKKARAFEDKLRVEQAQIQKIQYDLAKAKHDLKTISVKYDALQMELISVHENNSKVPSLPKVNMLDAKTSTTTVSEPEQRTTRAKRRTNDEQRHEQEVKKPKRVTRSGSTASNDTASVVNQPQDETDGGKKPKRITRNQSTASTNTNVPSTIKQSKKKSSNLLPDNKPDLPPPLSVQIQSINMAREYKAKPKTAVVRGRPKTRTIEIPIDPVEEHPPSPDYATIQRDPSVDSASFATVAVNSTTAAAMYTTAHIAASNDSVNITPKPSTFKRIQSFFRPSPTMTSSARANRVVQVKTTVAFGSSTPTRRDPPTIIKTAATPAAPPTPAASIVKKVATPKSKYNLRTRLFTNPGYNEKEEEEKKPRAKKPTRTRK